jgi:hypothetical protein
MSRYIDANKLIERLMHNPDFLIAPKHSKDGIIDEIVYQPTADVAPIADTVKRMQVLLHKKANYKVCGYYCVSTDDIDEIAKKVIGGAE